MADMQVITIVIITAMDMVTEDVKLNAYIKIKEQPLYPKMKTLNNPKKENNK